MKNTQQQEQFRAFERNGQLVLALNSEIMLPENAPVRRASAQLEELDYRKLYAAYSPKGRKSVVDPKVMFKVMVYAYECGIYSTRQMEEACRYRIDFMWLLEDQPVPDHSTFARFRTGRCAEAMGILNPFFEIQLSCQLNRYAGPFLHSVFFCAQLLLSSPSIDR